MSICHLSLCNKQHEREQCIEMLYSFLHDLSLHFICDGGILVEKWRYQKTNSSQQQFSIFPWKLNFPLLAIKYVYSLSESFFLNREKDLTLFSAAMQYALVPFLLFQTILYTLID